MQTPATSLSTNPRLKRSLFAAATLGLWTLVAADRLYRVAFDLWMTAYPFADAKEWRHRLSIHIMLAILTLMCWVANALWLYRQRRSR